MGDKLEIVWSEQAVKRVDQVIEYLEEHWTEKEIDNFLNSILGFEEIVSRFPEIYPESQILKGYRRAIILKQISIIYSVHSKEVRIHTLFDNREDPANLK